jgi:hypothetical protein
MRVVLVATVCLLAFTACPPGGVICNTGTTSCGAGCVDTTSDRRNCGGCAVACGPSQDCVESACQCQTGTTECNGSCVVTTYDALNCGGCGVTCADGGVCEASQCKAECSAGVNLRCGGSCVDPTSDVANCGACGLACGQGQSCRASACTYDVVAACFTSGQAVGFNATSLVKGPLAPLGDGPSALAVVSGALLSADGMDQLLYQATVDSQGIRQSFRANTIGSAVNQVVVDGDRVYVVNAGSGTLQVLRQGINASDVLSLDGGVAPVVAIGTVGELNFGMNSYPEGVAVAGGALWVPLYGGYLAGPAAAGQTVAKVVLSDAGQPSEAGRVSLTSLNLFAFDGGAPVPRPYAAVTHHGAVYVVLNNLNADTYAPEGPGLLARIDPASSAVAVVQIAGARCLDPLGAAEVGDRLAVSCGGKASYDPSTYALTGVSAAGVALLDAQDQLQAFWPASCSGGTDAGCTLPGRLTVRGSRLFVADQNAGRVVVLDVSDAGLTEVRGVTTSLDMCPVGRSGVANVSDLVSLP